jgi:hypothetical protein
VGFLVDREQQGIALGRKRHQSREWRIYPPRGGCRHGVLRPGSDRLQSLWRERGRVPSARKAPQNASVRATRFSRVGEENRVWLGTLVRADRALRDEIRVARGVN